MRFLNYPVEIWIAVSIAILVRLKTSMSLGFWGALTTTVVGAGAGLVLHRPLSALVGVTGDWEILMAILIALTSENLMQGIVRWSSQEGAAGRLLTAFITRDPSELTKIDD
ncbi:hypothetical protein [Paracoccus sp. SSK6]|uniref:hypothetical protein n=1 Tax=Paracoccus sp. SSK6 TaxID=3143131 RepID=UPI00321AEA94